MAEPKVGLSTVHYQSLCFPGGIIQHHCSAGSLDHAVQIVGYDTTGAVQYVYSKLCKGTVTGQAHGIFTVHSSTQSQLHG